mgnify:FL=1
MAQEPVLVVMAAGMGSRYGGNKQIDPITDQGDIIMDFSLYDAWKAGFKKVVFVIRRDFQEAFEAHIAPGAGTKLETVCVYQEMSDIPEGFQVPEGRTKPWGTGHAILTARDVIDGPFAVINADDYYGTKAFGIIYDYLKDHSSPDHYCMVGYQIENTLSDNGTVNRGICQTEKGLLTDVEEHFELGRNKDGEYAGKITGLDESGNMDVIPDGTPVSMNLWGFSKEYIGVMKEGFKNFLRTDVAENPMKAEFLLHHCADLQIKKGEATIKVLPTDDKWFGVTYKEDKPEVVKKFRAMKEQGIYPQDLWK